MSSVVLRRVAYAYVDAEPIFSGVELDLGPGFHGLVGANGAGKTTLLRILSGDLRPDEGEVRLEPAGAVIALCPQLVDVRDEAVAAFAEDEAGAARAIRGRLALDPVTLTRWETLSPGERKRWQIGAALAREPDVLLLDEPTNHLDERAKAQLLSALRRFDGIGIVVAHDRAFLDELTTSTIRVEGGEVAHYAGNHEKARSTWENEAAARADSRRAAVDEARAARRHADHVRAEHARSAKQLSTGARMKGPRDHDARGGLTKYRVAAAEAKVSRRVGTTRAEAERKAAAIPAFEVDKTLGRSLFVDFVPPPRARLLAFDGDVEVGGRPLLRGVHVLVERGVRIRIEGPNGAGKSTLVAALLASANLPADRLLFVPQELTAEEAGDALAAVRELPRDQKGRALSLVAALGLDPDRLLASCAPSPGEARKLLIARGLAKHAFALVLDEPTNHLDLPSIERLERALAAFPGALVVVTHDPSFLEGELDLAFHVEDGNVTPRTLVRRRKAR